MTILLSPLSAERIAIFVLTGTCENQAIKFEPLRHFPSCGEGIGRNLTSLKLLYTCNESRAERVFQRILSNAKPRVALITGAGGGIGTISCVMQILMGR